MSPARFRPCRALVVALLLAMPGIATAQTPLSELPLEELLRIDAGRVFGASKRFEPATEAPASVSFITAADIARYGYRTLADILRGVRGMYVGDDRNFSLLGTRGFSKPGDYNSRILLLVNGHRVNDNVYGQAEIGAEFGMDPTMFERVEIIRGPASSLYGDSAFFAVVNVITRSGESLNGVSMTVEAASLDTALTRISGGRKFENGLDVALSGTYERSSGVERLFFPAFDSPATNNGIAQGLDGERLSEIYAQLRFRTLIFTGGTDTGRNSCRRPRSARCSTPSRRPSRRSIVTCWRTSSTDDRLGPLRSRCADRSISFRPMAFIPRLDPTARSSAFSTAPLATDGRSASLSPVRFRGGRC